MGTEQFSLCWDNFHRNMSSGMHSLLANEDLVDVTLAIDGQYLKAHKMVLSVCSPYFRTLFSENPCKHPIVFMKDVSYIVMNDLLTFMYQGEVQVNQDNLATFIKTAEALQIKGLTGENNDSEDAVEEAKPSKRPAPEETKVLKTVKRVVGPPSKRARVSATPTASTPSTSSAPIALPETITNSAAQKSVKTETVTTVTSNSDNIVQFKMEPYDSSVDQSQTEGFEDDNQESYIDESIDDSQADDPEDYNSMKGEEPQAGTSDAVADSQGYYHSGIVQGTNTHEKIHILSKGPMTKRRKCGNCYRKLRATCSSREANSRVKKVATYCADCCDKPFCGPCFKECHYYYC